MLARRNMLSGRSDERGAARVAGTVGLTLLAAQLLEASGDAVLWRPGLEALSSGGALAAAFLRAVAMTTAYPIFLLFLLLLLRLLLRRPWLASVIAVAIVVGLGASASTDPLVQLPLALLSGAIPVLLLTRYGLLASATAMFMDTMSGLVIVSLDLSPFFARTMIVGLLLMAAPAILGFYASMAGRSVIGRRFELGP